MLDRLMFFLFIFDYMTVTIIIKVRRASKDLPDKLFYFGKFYLRYAVYNKYFY